MSTTEKVLAAIEVVGIVGAIIAGFLGERTASLAMIGLLLLLWQLWLTREVLALRQDAVLPKQAFELKKPRSSYLEEEPLLISSIDKNRLKIDSGFLLWEQCTLMMWVLVPPKRQGLRDSPSNRYLLAHYTGEADKEKWAYFNHFALRHSSRRERWEVRFSNDKAEYPPTLSIPDTLNPRHPEWHHFLIAWDHLKPKLVFFIDGGRSGNDFSTSYFPFWPERLAEKVFVGAGVSGWGPQYCETKLCHLLIFGGFLEPKDSVVKEHFTRKPRS